MAIAGKPVDGVYVHCGSRYSWYLLLSLGVLPRAFTGEYRYALQSIETVAVHHTILRSIDAYHVLHVYFSLASTTTLHRRVAQFHIYCGRHRSLARAAYSDILSFRASSVFREQLRP